MENESSIVRLRETIRVFVRKIGVLEKSEASCCGTTMAQCHAIVEIGRGGEISLNELAEILALDNSTMSRTINNLVNSGMVVREVDSKDRRYVKIKLTEEGQETFVEIEKNMKLYFTKIYNSIPEDKRAQVIDSVELLLEALNKNKCCE